MVRFLSFLSELLAFTKAVFALEVSLNERVNPLLFESGLVHEALNGDWLLFFVLHAATKHFLGALKDHFLDLERNIDVVEEHIDVL